MANFDGDRAPLFSVVITCFNYGQYIEEAVRSVQAQTLADREIIVVEGGSTDGTTPGVVAALASDEVRVMAQPRAHRVGANRNLGVAQARGRFIVCLDADDALKPTYLEKAAYLLQRRAADIVSSGLEMFGAEHGRVSVLHRPDLAQLLLNNHVLTCAAFRREMWERAGGFRDDAGGAGGHVHEDWVFWVRLAALGARVENMPEDHLLRYRVHPSSLSRQDEVLPMEEQRSLVRAANADVISLEAVRASRARNGPRPVFPPLPTPRPGVRQPPVLMIAVPWLVLGGAERLLSTLVRYLVRQGWEVNIVSTLRPSVEAGDTTDWFTASTPRVFHLPSFLDEEDWGDFVMSVLAERGVGTLLVVGSAFAYGLLRRVKVLFPTLSVVDLLFNTVGHVENNRRYRRFIDRVIVENREVREFLTQRGEADSRLALIQSGVDLTAVHPRLRTGALRTSLGVPDGTMLIGFCGRWSEEKNPLSFLELVAQCPARWPMRFVMTGAGPMRAAIEQRIAAAPRTFRRLHVLGMVEDVLPVVADLDLLVVPSLLDGRPSVVLEALGVGTPVLASAVGGLPELVRPGETGWLVAPGDLVAMLAVLEQIQERCAMLQDMRARARAYAERELSLHQMTAAFEAVLRPEPALGEQPGAGA